MVFPSIAFSDKELAVNAESDSVDLIYPVEGWSQAYLKYLNAPTQLLPADWKNRIDIPPPPNLQETLKEVDHIIELKALRDEYHQQINDQIQFFYSTFEDSLGIKFTNNREIKLLLDAYFIDTSILVINFKHRFNRARPWQYSSAIEPIIQPPGHPSYPSGHSTQAHVIALLLGDLAPNHSARLYEVANQIALNREIGGVHYRSDTKAGELLAEQIVELILRDHGNNDLHRRARIEFNLLLNSV